MTSDDIENLWSHLRLLTILQAQGSFTGAAARLGISKGAVSQKIAELEKFAGIALVSRTTRSVRLTDAGQHLVEQTQDHFETIAHSFSELRDSAKTIRGTVRVTAPVAFARQQLVPRIPKFVSQFPDVEIHLDVSDRLVSLSSEGFDVAIRHSTTAPDTHVARRLCKTQSVLVASRQYLQRHGTPQTPEDLSQHQCLYYPRPTGRPAWSFEQIGGKASTDWQRSVNIRGVFCANNSEALRDAAADHLGIALVPDFTAQAALRSGALVRVLPAWKPIGVFAEQLIAIRAHTSHVPRALTAFVNYLVADFRDGFPLPENQTAPKVRSKKSSAA